MMEFLVGAFLGGLLVFCFFQYKKWTQYYLINKAELKKAEEIVQFENMMNYDGSKRGQKYFEN